MEKNKELDNKNRNKFLFWLFFILILITIIEVLNEERKINLTNASTNDIIENTSEPSVKENYARIAVPDFSKISKSDVQKWCNSTNIICNIEEKYSSTIEKDKLISQSVKPNDIVYENDEITFTYSLGKKTAIKVPDFSKKSKEEIEKWCNENNVDLDIEEEYSTKVSKGNFIKQNVKAGETIEAYDELIIVYSLGKKPTTEDLNALTTAKQYSSTMHMSKKRLYEQLTSEYGEGFTKEAAQYAIDNIDADWNENALETAKSYQSTMNMSKKRIYQQLISDYGEGFTKGQAQYAIDHLDD